jgi:hypothetical protein
MHKRIQIAVRNPGNEGTEYAMGELSIDFKDGDRYVRAMRSVTDALSGETKTAILINEDGEELGFNPAYYVSHRCTNVDTWRETWLLPAKGEDAPDREKLGD